MSSSRETPRGPSRVRRSDACLYWFLGVAVPLHETPLCLRAEHGLETCSACNNPLPPGTQLQLEGMGA